MRRLRRLGALACLLGVLTWRQSATQVAIPHPDDGSVRAQVYTNRYFDLSYPLPAGWTEGMAAAGPSRSGNYVLSTLIPAGEFDGMVLIAAQDMFFAASQSGDAAAIAREFARAMAAVEGMIVDREPSTARIAGRLFSRVDYSGVGLFRTTLFTEIRCHIVSFNLTAIDADLLQRLVLSLDNIADAGDGAAQNSAPMCRKDHAGADNLLTKIDPAAVGPTFTPIPIRLIINADGRVKHVHVIRSTDAQRGSIEVALGKWTFKPHEVDGRAVDVETGLLIEFRPDGAVRYSPGAPGAANGPG